jgi:hypothetical protein
VVLFHFLRSEYKVEKERRLIPNGRLTSRRINRKRSGHQLGGADSIADIPKPLFQTWLPLLNHLSASVDNFADVLQDGLVQCITQPSSTMGKSFLDTAASWTIALFGEDKPTLSASKLQSRHQLFSELSEDDDGVERDRPTILLARRCLTFPTAM